MGFCTYFAVFVAVLVVARLVVTPRRNENPADTAVRVGANGWDKLLRQNLAVYGYAHIQGILEPAEVEGLRKLAQDFCYGDTRKAAPLSYGGYSVPSFLDLPEFSDARWLKDEPRLQKVLQATFNGSAFRFASHNDVGCDFVGVWHKDVLRGNVAHHQKCDVWSSDADGEQHEVYKLMFYLQDHEHDDQAAKFIPGSHRERRTPWERGVVALHPRLGDAVIFDQRISHAGNTYYNPFGPGRLFMQLGFGKSNRFTDEFERGTVERQATLQAKMHTSQQVRGWQTVLADVKFTLLGSLMTALPPQFLNYMADKDVYAQKNHNCASRKITTAPIRIPRSEL